VIRNREPILTHGAKAVRAEQKRPHLGHLKDANRTATVSLLTQGIAFLRLPVRHFQVRLSDPCVRVCSCVPCVSHFQSVCHPVLHS
jgi:hypothetical protein